MNRVSLFCAKIGQTTAALDRLLFLKTIRMQTHLKNQFRALRFAGTRLARDNDTLILPIAFHVCVRIIADSEYMRWQFADFPFFIQLNLVGRINWQYLIRIDSH